MVDQNIILTTGWGNIERPIGRLVALALEVTEEQRSWQPSFEGANSLATLVGHTIGNAEDNLLGTLCGLPVFYDREADFEEPVTDGPTILRRWDELRARIQDELAALDDSMILEPRQHPRRGEVLGIDVLFVVARHASEHLAQAEMVRDLLYATRQTSINTGKVAR